MEPMVGDLISISHNSKINPFRSIIIESKDDLLALKLIREFAIMNFNVGDSAVLSYEKDRKIYVFTSTLKEINMKLKCIIFKIEETRVIDNERQFERFSTSTYCQLKSGDGEPDTGILKDISLNGAEIFSPKEYPLDKPLETLLFINDVSVSIPARIVRKVKNPNFTAYGIQFTSVNSDEYNMLKVYIYHLGEEQNKVIKDLKSGFYGSFLIGKF